MDEIFNQYHVYIMKNKTIHTLILLFVMFMGVNTITAQSAKMHTGTSTEISAADRASKSLDKWNKRLKFSQNQRTQMEPLLTDFYTEMKAIKSNTSLSEEQKKSEAKKVRQDFRSKVETILSPSQMERMKKFRQSRSKKK